MQKNNGDGFHKKTVSRRHFLGGAALGAAALAVQPLRGFSKKYQSQTDDFKLKYAPSLGMF